METDKQILNELKSIKDDINYIKKHIKDFDLVLTDDDLDSIKEAEKDFKEEKTKRI